ncbi:MAG: MarR family transcriptional regulator [Vallitaleaceae bacterium]|jgi:DNA-binding MarR family transcriptional regulator|nr:MarR family transcriptional regulator [Vallitaleaceae bacterium]
MKEISFGRYTSILYRYIQMIISHRLSAYDMGSGQYLFLITIAKHGGINQKDLTQQMNVDKATTAKALAKLESLTYIRRIKDENDRRYYSIYLTEKGKAFMPVLKKHLSEISDILITDMTDEETALTKHVFDIMIRNAIDEVGKLK